MSIGRLLRPHLLAVHVFGADSVWDGIHFRQGKTDWLKIRLNLILWVDLFSFDF